MPPAHPGSDRDAPSAIDLRANLRTPLTVLTLAAVVIVGFDF